MKAKLLRKIITFSLVLLFAKSGITAQFTTISTQNGLSSNSVVSITQDSLGFMWFATLKGLNRYNGYNIKTYYADKNDSTSLAHNEIKTIFYTSTGDLLIGTRNGISIYNPEQDNFTTYNLNVAEKPNALPNYFNDILEDKDKNIWVATSTGLYLFDIENKIFKEQFNHKIFTHFVPNDIKKLESLGVPEYVTVKLKNLQDRFFYDEPEMIDALYKLLGEVDHKQFSSAILQSIKDKQKPFYPTSVNTMTLDEDNNIWLGLSNGHLVRLDNKREEIKIAYIAEQIDIETNIASMFARDHEVWFASLQTGKIFDTKTWQLKSKLTPLEKQLINKRGIIFAPISDQKLWVGAAGLTLYNKETETIEKYNTDYSTPNSISSDYVTDIFCDKQNQIWIATNGGGVNKVKTFKKFNSINKEFNSATQSVDNTISAVLVQDNEIWLGYYTGGINVYNEKGKKLRSYSYYPKNKNRNIGTGTIGGIIKDKDGIIWISSYFGGLQFLDKSKNKFIEYELFHSTSDATKENHILKIICDDSNNLWVNTLGKGFFKISSNRKLIQHFTTNDNNYKPSISSDWVRNIYTDPYDNCIFTIDENIYQIDEAKKTIVPLLSNPLSERITYVHPLKKDILLLGTTSGIFILNKNENDVNKVENSKFLDKFSITNILPDNEGNLWVSTDNGLFKVTLNTNDSHVPKAIDIKRFSTSDGLLSNTFINNTSCKNDDGKLFFGTDNGLIHFVPDSIKDNSHIPTVVITDVKIFNNTITPGVSNYLKKQPVYTKKITLPYNQNFISFNFASLSYINPEANSYAYMMEGIDQEWNYVGNKREANYTKLPHGHYVFKVKGSNNDGIWNEQGTQIEVIINPPFWKTSIAFMVYVFLLVWIFIGFRLLVANREKHKARNELEKLRFEKDNELNKVKLSFFTNISHEFRTPLTLMLGPLESIIEKGKNDPNQINLVYRNTKKLLTLVNQIMDLRKIDVGKMRLEKNKIEIIDYTKKLVDNFNYQCSNKNILLEMEHLEPSLWTWIDPFKYETILNNLLSNALKFTPRGGQIKVLLKREDLDLGHQFAGTFSLSVSDTGKGISSLEKDQVFERFYQSKDNESSGSGIGLTLVHELTNLQKGKVELESELDQGSKFIIYLPIEENIEENEKAKKLNFNNTTSQSEDISNNQSTASIDDYSSNLPLILVVEDNEEVRNYTVSEIRDDYRVIEAENGKIAVDLAMSTFPDLIISDIMMPVMDGIEMCNILKNGEKTSHIPIVLLTAYNNENTSIAGYETGADDFIVKPFSPKVLKIRIKNILETRDKLKDKFSNLLYSIPTNKTINKLDEEFINKAIKIVEDNLVEPKFNIEFLCREMGFSRTALYSKIKTLTDQSISEFIKLIRLKKAIELFREGKKSVNEVAFLVGFKTHSHFSRCFSEEFDMSPTEFISKLENDSK